MLTPVSDTGLPGQHRAYTLGTIAADATAVQTGFGLGALNALTEWSRSRGSFAACGHLSSPLSLQDGQRATVRLVSHDCLTALQLPLVAGRTLSDVEHAAGTSSQVCIASQRIVDRLNGKVDVGTTIHGLDRQCVVVGIAAGSVLGFAPDAKNDDHWMPLESSPGMVYGQLAELESMNMIHLAIVGTGSEAQAANRDELDSLFRRATTLDGQHRLLVEPGVSTDIARSREIANLQSTAMLIAVALFIATLGNSALLTESAIASRRQSLAVRTAVGASPFRLLRDVLTESAVVATFGAMTGIGASYVLLKFAVDLDYHYAGASITASKLALPAAIAMAATVVQLLLATLASAPRHVGMFGSIAVTVGVMLPLAIRIANTNPNVLLRV